jgi:choline dehydrogenase-like flavoprotein
MSAEKFDVVIIGGGNAGIGVTGAVRRAGLSVAMIEWRDLGGTCPNRGCTPKKVPVAAGQALHDIERASVHQIAIGQPKLDWAALIAREKDMIKDIPENLARAMARRKVEVVKGYGTFAGPDFSSGRGSHASRRPHRDRWRIQAPAAVHSRRPAHGDLGRHVERKQAPRLRDLHRRRHYLAGIRPCLCASRQLGHDPGGAAATLACDGH